MGFHLVTCFSLGQMVVHWIELRKSVSHFEPPVDNFAGIAVYYHGFVVVVLEDRRVLVNLSRIHWAFLPVLVVLEVFRLLAKRFMCEL